MDYISSQSTGNGQLHHHGESSRIGTKHQHGAISSHKPRAGTRCPGCPQESSFQGVPVKKDHSGHAPGVSIRIHRTDPAVPRTSELLHSSCQRNEAAATSRAWRISGFWAAANSHGGSGFDSGQAAASNISASDILNFLRAQNAQC